MLKVGDSQVPIADLADTFIALIQNGNADQRDAVRALCEQTLDKSTSWAAIPTEIWTRILREVVFGKRWAWEEYDDPTDRDKEDAIKAIRSVCSTWKEIIDASAEFFECDIGRNLINECSIFDRMCAPKLKAFWNMRVLKIDIETGLGLDYVCVAIATAQENCPNLRKVEIYSSLPMQIRKRQGVAMSDRTYHPPSPVLSKIKPAEWKSTGFFYEWEVPEVEFSGPYFTNLSVAFHRLWTKEATESVFDANVKTFRLPSTGTTYICPSQPMIIENDRAYMGILSYSTDDVKHIFCCKKYVNISEIRMKKVDQIKMCIIACKTPRTKPFDFGDLDNLDTLGIGSIWFSCVDCTTKLPSRIRTLEIHHPDLYCLTGFVIWDALRHLPNMLHTIKFACVDLSFLTSPILRKVFMAICLSTRDDNSNVEKLFGAVPLITDLGTEDPTESDIDAFFDPDTDRILQDGILENDDLSSFLYAKPISEHSDGKAAGESLASEYAAYLCRQNGIEDVEYARLPRDTDHAQPQFAAPNYKSDRCYQFTIYLGHEKTKKRKTAVGDDVTPKKART